MAIPFIALHKWASQERAGAIGSDDWPERPERGGVATGEANKGSSRDEKGCAKGFDCCEELRDAHSRIAKSRASNATLLHRCPVLRMYVRSSISNHCNDTSYSK